MNVVKNHNELSDSEFELQFANSTLNPEIFSHEAHLRLCYLHISKYGIRKAERNIKEQIKKYVSKLGAFEKYNETVTIASIRIVNHFMQKSKLVDFKMFIARHEILSSDFKSLLKAHYKINIFDSPEAKTKYIEPEILPFD